MTPAEEASIFDQCGRNIVGAIWGGALIAALQIRDRTPVLFRSQ